MMAIGSCYVMACGHAFPGPDPGPRVGPGTVPKPVLRHRAAKALPPQNLNALPLEALAPPINKLRRQR